MDDFQHTVLCVDDEEAILHSLKRLLRKEGYQLLTATSADEGLKILEENDVHLVISDQRMPQMSGTEFFAAVKEQYPDTIRIILSGYTDVDSITESINKGHVYKFFLKPWNDQSLKLEIRQALNQYDLIQANRGLNEKVLEQNEALKKTNENLETLVKERTMELEIQNQALELSRAILEDLDLPIVGVSAEGTIALFNREAKSISINGNSIEIGKDISDYFSTDARDKMVSALETSTTQLMKQYSISGVSYNINITPLSGRFMGKGVIVSLKQGNR
ncbi:MAG: response regulator [Deltaproteobacteria bacterium]|nr:response regulator [Deltaproteobacteria bacterium]